MVKRVFALGAVALSMLVGFGGCGLLRHDMRSTIG